MDQEPLTQFQQSIRTAEICIACEDVLEVVSFFTEQLGFRVDLIFPADSPRTAVVSGYGIRIRIETGQQSVTPVSLRLHCELTSLPVALADTRHLIAPNGMRIEFVDVSTPVELPGDAVNREWVLTRGGGEDGWSPGRAGMQYRDLIPSRLGGRFIASQIRIPDGGDVPDYIHYHKVRFQMIFCKTGWVRVVYEDQGEPFVLHAGDCVLQPPEIRHRVLEASPGLEVIEVGCPAVHETWADHSLSLPTKVIKPDRLFGGQQFVRYSASRATWQPSSFRGFETSDTGIGPATNGLASVRVLRARGASNVVSKPDVDTTAAEFHFMFVLLGELELSMAAIGDHLLGAGDCCVVPGDSAYSLQTESGAEVLEVTLPSRPSALTQSRAR